VGHNDALPVVSLLLIFFLGIPLWLRLRVLLQMLPDRLDLPHVDIVAVIDEAHKHHDVEHSHLADS